MKKAENLTKGPYYFSIFTDLSPYLEKFFTPTQYDLITYSNRALSFSLILEKKNVVLFFKREHTKYQRFRPSFGELKEFGKFIKFFFALSSFSNSFLLNLNFYFLAAKKTFFLICSLIWCALLLVGVFV